MITFLGELRRMAADTAVTLHTPSIIWNSDDAMDRQLRTLVGEQLTAGTIEVWSAGYTGAAADLLHPGEAELERRWGESNRWHEGLTDRFGIEGLRYAPFRVTAAQATLLAEGDFPVCVGAPALPKRTEWREETYTLWDGAGTGRSRQLLPVMAARIDADGSLPAPAASASADSVHIVLPRNGMNTAEGADAARTVASLLLRYRKRENGAATASDGVHPASPLCIGANPYSPAREPHVLARLFRMDRTVSLDETGGLSPPKRESVRSVLLAAGDRRPAAGDAAHDDGVPPAAVMPEGAEWELQGSVFGTLSIDEPPLQTSFIAGRAAGVRRNMQPGEGEQKGSRSRRDVRRSQGYIRRRTKGGASADYLDTRFAAWFTGDGIRGIKESAVLRDVLEVHTTGIVKDDVPALVLNQLFVVQNPTVDGETVSPYEFPLCILIGEDTVSVTCDDHTAGISAARIGEVMLSGHRLSVDAGAYRIHLQPGGADDRRGRNFIVPFHLVLFASGDEVVVALRTTPAVDCGERENGDDPFGAVTDWTTSYVFSIDEPPSSVPEESIPFTAREGGEPSR